MESAPRLKQYFHVDFVDDLKLKTFLFLLSARNASEHTGYTAKLSRRSGGFLKTSSL